MNGHIRARGPGAWELKYDVGRDPKTGKRATKYKTVRGKKSDAQRELRNLLGAADKGIVTDAGRMTIGAWLEQWIQEARHTVSPKTHERYSEIVHKHLVPALGVLPLAKLAPVHIQGFYSDALTSGRLDGKGGLSPQTVVHFDRVLHLALKRARSLRLIAVNPAEDVERPQVERREMQTLDDDQGAQLLAAAATTRLYVPIVLAVATGLRRGELLALRWQDIDLKMGVVQVVRSLEQPTRGSVSRPRRRTAAGARSCYRPASSTCYVTTRLGKRRNGCCSGKARASYVHPRRRAPDRAGHVHQLGGAGGEARRRRAHHARARLAAYAHHEPARANVHPKVASERAGHSSVGFTLDRYSHVIPSLQEDAALRIDAALRKTLAR